MGSRWSGRGGELHRPSPTREMPFGQLAGGGAVEVAVGVDETPGGYFRCPS